MDSTRSKAKLKSLINSAEFFAKTDLVSPEPIPKKETVISTVPLLSTVEKGKLILNDDMESVKYLSVTSGQGESYIDGKLHLNSLHKKSGHAYSFYPRPFDQLDNFIFEGDVDFLATKNKYNKLSVVVRLINDYLLSNFYHFFFNNDGKYEIYLTINGTKTNPIIPLQSTLHLNRGVSKNKFRIVAYDSKFDFYLNDNFIVGFEHESLEKGAIGFMADWGKLYSYR